MVLHLSDDLMLVGKVSSWAKSNGASYKSVAKADDLLKRANDDAAEIDTVVVDLQLRDLQISSFAASLRNCQPNARLIGYAQHVMVDLIDEAKQNGFDQVLTRGQFDRQFPQVFSETK